MLLSTSPDSTRSFSSTLDWSNLTSRKLRHSTRLNLGAFSGSSGPVAMPRQGRRRSDILARIYDGKGSLTAARRFCGPHCSSVTVDSAAVKILLACKTIATSGESSLWIRAHVAASTSVNCRASVTQSVRKSLVALAPPLVKWNPRSLGTDLVEATGDPFDTAGNYLVFAASHYLRDLRSAFHHSWTPANSRTLADTSSYPVTAKHSSTRPLGVVPLVPIALQSFSSTRPPTPKEVESQGSSHSATLLQHVV